MSSYGPLVASVACCTAAHNTSPQLQQVNIIIISWDQTCCSCCSVSHNVLTVRISRALQIFLCVGTFLYNFMVKWKFSKKQVPGAGKCGHRRSLYLTSFIGNQLQFGQFAWFLCSIITNMVLLFYTLNTQVSSLSSLLGNR